MFSSLFSITLSNIEKYFLGIDFLEIHFPQNLFSKKILLFSKQTGLRLGLGSTDYRETGKPKHQSKALIERMLHGVAVLNYL